VVVQHHPPSHLPAALQVGQRCARLVGQPCFERDRWYLAGLDQREQLPKILKRADIGPFESHHLEREQHGGDRVGTAVEPDHDELAAFAQDVDTELHRLRRTDEVDRCGRAASRRLHDLLDRIGCRVVDGGDGPHLACVSALLRVDVGDNDFAGDRGRGDVHRAATDPAGADDHQMVVGAHMPSRLFERRKGGDAGAGVGRGEPLRHPLMRQQVASVRYDHMRAVAASASRAECARGEAEQLLTPPAHRAFAATDPRVGHHLVADLDPRGLWPECGHFACDLVPHRERQMHAARFERDLLPPAQIEEAVPDMDVAMADPRRLDAQQHLLAFGLGIRIFPHLQRLAPFDDLHCTHASVLLF
jgi:hypothetical protein